jgi:prevent-host-death family protein
MRTITVEEAKARLSELLEAALQGEELVITGDGGAYRVVVTPVPASLPGRSRVPDLHPGAVAWMSEDFNAPLPDTFWLGDA